MLSTSAVQEVRHRKSAGQGIQKTKEGHLAAERSHRFRPEAYQGARQEEERTVVAVGRTGPEADHRSPPAGRIAVAGAGHTAAEEEGPASYLARPGCRRTGRLRRG